MTVLKINKSGAAAFIRRVAWKWMQMYANVCQCMQMYANVCKSVLIRTGSWCKWPFRAQRQYFQSISSDGDGNPGAGALGKSTMQILCKWEGIAVVEANPIQEEAPARRRGRRRKRRRRRRKLNPAHISDSIQNRTTGNRMADSHAPPGGPDFHLQ